MCRHSSAPHPFSLGTLRTHRPFCSFNVPGHSLYLVFSTRFTRRCTFWECDRAKSGDSFTYLESRILQSLSRSSRSGSGAPRSENPASVFFCRDFQHGTCKHQKDHFGTLRGERKWFQHICARCWVDSRLLARHSEFAKECPLFTDTSKQKTTSSADSQVWLSRDLGLSSVTFSLDSRLILLSNCQASLLHGSSPDARPFRSLLADSTPVFMEFNQDSSLLDEFSRDSRLSRSCGQLDSRLNSVLDDPLVWL